MISACVQGDAASKAAKGRFPAPPAGRKEDRHLPHACRVDPTQLQLPVMPRGSILSLGQAAQQPQSGQHAEGGPLSHPAGLLSVQLAAIHRSLLMPCASVRQPGHVPDDWLLQELLAGSTRQCCARSSPVASLDTAASAGARAAQPPPAASISLIGLPPLTRPPLPNGAADTSLPGYTYGRQPASGSANPHTVSLLGLPQYLSKAGSQPQAAARQASRSPSAAPPEGRGQGQLAGSSSPSAEPSAAGAADPAGRHSSSRCSPHALLGSVRYSCPCLQQRQQDRAG